MNTVAKHEKVQSVVVYLEGNALSWFQWMEVRSPVRDWVTFKMSLLERFRLLQDCIAHEELMSLWQVGSVAEYRTHFEMLSAPLGDMSDDLLKGAFVIGLREDIRAEVRLLGSRDLAHCMSLAQKVDKNLALERVRGMKGPWRPTSVGWFSPSPNITCEPNEVWTECKWRLEFFRFKADGRE